MVSNEDFLNGVTWLDMLKLHTSYGVTGNTDIEVYRSLAVFTSNTGTVIGGARANQAWPSRMANPDLRWERQSQYDVGLALNSFGNRLNLEISGYYKYTSDLLLLAPIPVTSGFNDIWKNVGAISNRGLDAMITGVPVQSRDFNWSVTVNANYNANRVEKLNEGGADMFVGDNWVGARVIMRVVEPMGQFYGLERIGIKSPEYVAVHGGRVGTALRSPDLKVLGKGMPDWTGSFINRFSYKNFDFMADFQFVIGGKIRQDFYHSTEDRFGLTSGLRTILTEAWTDGKPTDQPDMVQAIRIGAFDGQDSNFDTRWLADASYLRGNLFQLGYNCTPQQAKSVGVSALRAYVSVDNLFVITSKEFQGFDPEASTRGRFEPNTFFFSYPKPRTFTLGLNVTF
jgi:outer membrane receptor protein involved in Fe transport